MTNVIPEWHPYWYLRDLLRYQQHDIQFLHFSYYNYVPQSVLDERSIFSVSVVDFLNVESMINIFLNTPPNMELAFHSNVTTSLEHRMHIPMVDMSTGSAAQLDKLKLFLDNSIFQGFKWYKSGRSYHGYCNALITDDDWIKLMGRLLLANQIGFPPTVDPRWVGHRLIAGYSSLRWTKNTPHYVGYPKEI